MSQSLMEDKPKNIENEVAEAMNLAKNMFEERYLKKAKIMSLNKLENMEVPQTELAFIKVFSKFMPEEEHVEVSNFVDTILTASTLKDLKEEVTESLSKKSELEKKKIFEISMEEFNTSIHNDGIYDFDPKCVACKNKRWKKGIELLLLMAFSKGELAD